MEEIKDYKRDMKWLYWDQDVTPKQTAICPTCGNEIDMTNCGCIRCEICFTKICGE